MMMNPDLWTLRSRGSDSCRAVACEKAEAPAAASSTRILQHICAATIDARLSEARNPHASQEDLHAVLMTMARTGVTDFFVGDLDWVLCSIIVHVCLV